MRKTPFQYLGRGFRYEVVYTESAAKKETKLRFLCDMSNMDDRNSILGIHNAKEIALWILSVLLLADETRCSKITVTTVR